MGHKSVESNKSLCYISGNNVIGGEEVGHGTLVRHIIHPILLICYFLASEPGVFYYVFNSLLF